MSHRTVMWITVAGDGTASPVFIPANLGSTELGGADGRFRGGGGGARWVSRQSGEVCTGPVRRPCAQPQFSAEYKVVTT